MRFHSKTLSTAAILIVTLIVTLLYWQGLAGPFLLDDLPSIEGAKLTNFTLNEFISISLSNDTGPLGRPISIASFILNDYFWGPLPFSYKAVNLGIHILNFFSILWLTYFLSRLLTTTTNARRISLLVSTIWVCHPLLASTVLYAVQRMTQLSHLFILLGLNSYIYGRLRLITHKKWAYPWMLASLIVFFPLSILSKETGILFPWYLFCIEYFIFQYRAAKPHQNIIRSANVGLSLGLLFAALIYYWMQLSKFLALYAEKNITLFDRLMTQAKALVFYIQLILLPNITKMGLYHDDFPIAYKFNLSVFISCLILLALAGIIYYFRRRQPVIAFGLAWFFVSHAVESTGIPLEMVFEHRNYSAMIGLLFIPTYYLVINFHKLRLAMQWYTGITVTLILALLMNITYHRSVDWSSSENFLRQEARYHPKSTRVHIELANHFLKNSDYISAFLELNYAQTLQPLNAGISLHKILILCRAKQIPNEIYQDALNRIPQSQISPYLILVLNQMVDNMFNQQCQGVDKDKIIEIIRVARQSPYLKYKPRYRATLFHLEGGIEVLKHNLDKSLVLLDSAYHANPTQLDALLEKAYLEIEHELYDQAGETLLILNAAKTYDLKTINRIHQLNEAWRDFQHHTKVHEQ